jgi:hypothetical protein
MQRHAVALRLLALGRRPERSELGDTTSDELRGAMAILTSAFPESER